MTSSEKHAYDKNNAIYDKCDQNIKICDSIICKEKVTSTTEEVTWCKY